MSNPFYTYGNSLIPGTLGRAETVATELTNIQIGFAKVSIQGVDSGSASAYVVTTTAGQPTTGPYVDGQQISFKAANTNSGAATLAVNGIAASSIYRFNGGALQAGDIAANTWITVTYDSSFTGWTLPASASVSFTGTISGAAPTHKVGLAAAGGVSTNAIPIDVTFAIDQTISPTWTGNHTFTGTSTFSGPLTVSGTSSFSSGFTASGTSTFSGPLTVSGISSFSGVVTIGVPAAGANTALTVNGNATNPAFQINASGLSNIGAFDSTNATGGYVGWTTSGVAAGYIGAAAALDGGAAAHFCVRAQKQLDFSISGATQAMYIGTGGNVVINSPGAGAFTALSVTGNSTNLALQINAAALSSVGAFDSTNASGGYVGWTTSGVAVGYVGAAAALDSGVVTNFCVRAQKQLDLAVNGNISAVAAMTLGTAGNVVINAPAAGAFTALTVIGNSTNLAFQCNGTGLSNMATFDSTNVNGGYLKLTKSAAAFAYMGASGAIGIGASSTNLGLYSNGLDFSVSGTNAQMSIILGTGVVINALSGGVPLTVNSTGTIHPCQQQDSAQGGPFNMGYLEIPQSSFSAARPIVLADSGKTLYHPVGDANARTVTIPANASISFPVGATITIINRSPNAVTIAITTDTLTWCPSGSTGSRTLAQYGVATITKTVATEWVITGVGLS